MQRDKYVQNVINFEKTKMWRFPDSKYLHSTVKIYISLPEVKFFFTYNPHFFPFKFDYTSSSDPFSNFSSQASNNLIKALAL